MVTSERRFILFGVLYFLLETVNLKKLFKALVSNALWQLLKRIFSLKQCFFLRLLLLPNLKILKLASFNIEQTT